MIKRLQGECSADQRQCHTVKHCSPLTPLIYLVSVKVEPARRKHLIPLQIRTCGLIDSVEEASRQAGSNRWRDRGRGSCGRKQASIHPPSPKGSDDRPVWRMKGLAAISSYLHLFLHCSEDMQEKGGVTGQRACPPRARGQRGRGAREIQRGPRSVQGRRGQKGPTRPTPRQC